MNTLADELVSIQLSSESSLSQTLAGEIRREPVQAEGGVVIPPVGGIPRTIASRRSASRSRRTFRTRRGSLGERS